MKIVVERTRIKIIPESPQDHAYLEEVLGLWNEGDRAACTRVDYHRLEGIAHIDITNESTC